MRLLCLLVCLVPVSAYAADGYVLYTRGAAFEEPGTLRVHQLGGGTWDIEDDVASANFSPDGGQIIYAHDNGTSWEIVRCARDGSGRTMLSDGWAESPRFSWRIPGTVIFAHNREQQVWQIDPSTGEVSVFYPTSAGNDFWSVSVSTDATRMTFYSRSVTRGIWIADLVTTAESHVHSGCGNAISPDGTLFTNNLGSHQDMLIRNWDTTEYTSIGITGEYWNSQRWSRNHNRWIIYSRGPEFYLEAYSNVYIRNIDTDEEVQVTSDDAHDTHRDFWEGTASSAPVIQLDASALTFNYVEGGVAPASQDVHVTNAGGGTLTDVSCADDATWLTVTHTPGDPQVVTNAVDPIGLATGTHDAVVTVSGGGATVDRTYDVTLVVVPDSVTNLAPVVNAGPDQTITLGETAILAGQASDDGEPSGSLTLAWTGSGPGAVIFFDAAAVDSEVSFALDGSYTLTLTADDGLLASSDELTVVVEPSAEPSITLIEPRGGEVWEVGSTQQIRWTTVVVDDVTVRYSLDNGQSWEMISSSVDHTMAGWMDYPWEVPDVESEEVLISVTDYFDPALADQSASFSIAVGASTDAPPPSALIAVACGCAPGGQVAFIGLLIAWGVVRRRR